MAKAVVDMTRKTEQIDTTLDNVVMPVVIDTIANGRSLDVSDFTGTHIKGGHLIIKKDGEAFYKPMPIKADGTGYDALPAGYSYNSFQYGTVRKDRAFGALMVRGVLVTEASPYPLDDILADLKEALPLVTFKTKED